MLRHLCKIFYYLENDFHSSGGIISTVSERGCDELCM